MAAFCIDPVWMLTSGMLYHALYLPFQSSRVGLKMNLGIIMCTSRRAFTAFVCLKMQTIALSQISSDAQGEINLKHVLGRTVLPELHRRSPNARGETLIY